MALGPLTNATDFQELVDAFEKELRARAAKLGWSDAVLAAALGTVLGRMVGQRAEDTSDLILGMEKTTKLVTGAAFHALHNLPHRHSP